MRRLYNFDLLKDQEDDYEEPTLFETVFQFLATATLFLGMFTMLLACLSMMG